jgi:transposase
MGDVVNFSRKERMVVDSIVAASKDFKQFQRAQALLWLDDGECVEEVASRLSGARPTIYNWILRVQAESEQSLAQRRADAPRSGRPPTAQGIIDPLSEPIIDTDPREFGYRSTVWTAALLVAYLAEYQHVEVSWRSVGYALERLDIHWKFPRYDLVRSSPTSAKKRCGSRLPRGKGTRRRYRSAPRACQINTNYLMCDSSPGYRATRPSRSSGGRPN